MDALADMLEARAGSPGCQRLKTLKLHMDWFCLGTLDSQIRLLRLLCFLLAIWASKEHAHWQIVSAGTYFLS